MLNIAVIPEVMSLYDKGDDCSIINTHLPQNSIMPTARVYSLIFTPQPLHSNLQFIFRIVQRHRILPTKLLN
jgi:hypothetical protein